MAHKLSRCRYRLWIPEWIYRRGDAARLFYGSARLPHKYPLFKLFFKFFYFLKKVFPPSWKTPADIPRSCLVPGHLGFLSRLLDMDLLEKGTFRPSPIPKFLGFGKIWECGSVFWESFGSSLLLEQDGASPFKVGGKGVLTSPQLLEYPSFP